MIRRLNFAVFSLIIFWATVPACNLSDDTELSDPECLSDVDCLEGVCDEELEQCRQCIADEHCSGDEICRDHECRSGCDEFDCGDGGTCVDEDSQIHCECADGYFLDGGICHACECDIENGTGECDADGTCIIASCDEDYFTEDDDPATGCECGPEDWPDPVEFADRNCDGVDGDASRAVFVSPFGDDDHDGIRTRPVRTINRAIEIASDSESRKQILIAEGEYDEVIRLDEPISLFGGYFDAGLGEWERSHDYETVISGIDVDDGHYPVEVGGIDGDVEFQLMTIRADDAPEPSFFDTDYEPDSSVGITVFDVEGHVHMSHMTIETGHGAVGLPGSVGTAGEDGLDGADGGGSDSPEEPGQPSSQTCAFASDAGIGGAGGAGRTSDSEVEGHPGEDAPGSGGGDGGSAGLAQVYSACGDPQSSEHGEEGDNASATGDNGAHGMAASQKTHLVIDHQTETPLRFQGAPAENGHPGEAGYGGGGGGGGGGLMIGFFNTCMTRDGNGGGAGGNGGCPGQGGEAGQWGGASIGIITHSSSLSITDSFIATGNGGDGGDGAIGGEGGAGGTGGDGAVRVINDDGDTVEDAGDGGDGSPGGDGGAGAGGLGGPSIGVLYTEGELDTEELSFELGEGGEGGVGGADDNDGLPGIEAEILEADDDSS